MYFIFHSCLLHWFSRMVTCYLHRDKGLEDRICGNHTYTHTHTFPSLPGKIIVRMCILLEEYEE